MQLDFHYYGTYLAAFLAGYTHEECLVICYSANFVDSCTETLLKSVKGPSLAATTQTPIELAYAESDIITLQNITRIWASFHFLPYDLHADVKGSKLYKDRYRMICNSNGDLVLDTVNLAKGKSLEAVGLAMHVLADSWAHKYFAGTPSRVINNTNYYFYEILENDHEETKRLVKFRSSLGAPDDLENGIFTQSLASSNEISIMNLGHGRAGHFPDFCFEKYVFMPAWGGCEVIVKDNPSDYMHAFSQMVYALTYLRGEHTSFQKDTYDTEHLKDIKDELECIFRKRQLNAEADLKALGEKLSGQEIPDYKADAFLEEYKKADVDHKGDTFLGRFADAAILHKGMVTNAIYQSGNKVAGFSKVKKGVRP